VHSVHPHRHSRDLLRRARRFAQDVPRIRWWRAANARGWRGNQRHRPYSARLQTRTIAALKSAIRTLFFSKLLREEAIAKTLEEYGELTEVRRLVDFIKNSERGVVGRERE